MPPKKKSTSSPAAKKAAGRARARSADSTAITVSSNVPVVFGRVVFVKHILLFAVDSRDPFAGLHALFSWRRVNSAWLDTIHNFLDAEIWRPFVRVNLLPIAAGADDITDSEQEGHEEDEEEQDENDDDDILHQLFRPSDTTDFHLFLLRFLAAKNLVDLTRPFSLPPDFEWEEWESPWCNADPEEQYTPFAHALLRGNAPLVKLIVELIDDVEQTVNTPIRIIEVEENEQCDERFSKFGDDGESALVSPLYIAIMNQPGRLDMAWTSCRSEYEALVDFLVSVPGARDVALAGRATALQALCVPRNTRPCFDEIAGHKQKQGAAKQQQVAVKYKDADDATVTINVSRFFDRTFRALVAGPSKKVLDHRCNEPGCFTGSNLTSHTAFSLLIYSYAFQNFTSALPYAQLLLDAGASVAACMSASGAPLHMAAQVHDKELMRWLIQRGFDANAVALPYARSDHDDAGHFQEQESYHYGYGCVGPPSNCKECLAEGLGPVEPASLLLLASETYSCQHCGRRDQCYECDAAASELQLEEAMPCLQLLLDHGATFPTQKKSFEFEYVSKRWKTSECPLSVAAALYRDTDLLRRLVQQCGVPISQYYCYRHEERPRGPTSALKVAVDDWRGYDVVRLIVDELKCPLHWNLFGHFKKKSEHTISTESEEVSKLDAPTREFIRMLRQGNWMNNDCCWESDGDDDDDDVHFVDILTKELETQFAEFAAACRSGSIARVKAFITRNSLSRCHWPDTDAPDFVKEITEGKGNQKSTGAHVCSNVSNDQRTTRRVVDAEAFVHHGGKKAAGAWTRNMPAAVTIKSNDFSWVAFSKMTLQKVWRYTPEASRNKIVDLLLDRMESSEYKCM